VTAKVPLLPVTEIFAGTLASVGLLLNRPTLTGKRDAGISVTVPVAVPPLATSAGWRVRSETAPSATSGRPMAASPTTTASSMASV
jgi:hypothetical protein